MNRNIEIKSITHQETLIIRHLVLWPNEVLDFVKLENDEEGKHYGLFLNNNLISVISVFINNNAAQFRKFATLEAHQGKGYGTLLIGHMLKTLEDFKVDYIWCNARLDAIDFYKRFNFKKSSSKEFLKGNIRYIIMEKFSKK